MFLLEQIFEISLYGRRLDEIGLGHDGQIIDVGMMAVGRDRCEEKVLAREIAKAAEVVAVRWEGVHLQK